MAQEPHSSTFEQLSSLSKSDAQVALVEFGRWVVVDLKRAKVPNERLMAVALGTLSTMRAFLRGYRRETLKTNPNLTARQLAKQQSEFEDGLLRSLVQALPRPGKKGRKRDSATRDKFTRIVELRCEGKTWTQIEKTFNQEFGLSGQGTCQRLYRRYRPIYLDPRLPPNLLALRRLTTEGRRPGRPPKKN